MFSVLPSACRPPGVTVKFEVTHKGGWCKNAYGTKMMRWSRWRAIVRESAVGSWDVKRERRCAIGGKGNFAVRYARGHDRDARRVESHIT